MSKCYTREHANDIRQTMSHNGMGVGHPESALHLTTTTASTSAALGGVWRGAIVDALTINTTLGGRRQRRHHHQCQGKKEKGRVVI